MVISVIISSYNQCKRLRHCLDSAVKLKTKFADSIEIIVTDDNSTDGSVELIKQYPVKLWTSTRGVKEKYTLASNWNDAVFNVAKGDRVLFTNGDHILTSWFADNHADPVMCDDIIFGPGFQTHPNSLNLIEDPTSTYKDIVNNCSSNKWILPDRHVEGSTQTYNVEWPSNFPYGYNFSVRRDHFESVGGFEEREYWGGEEQTLCDKIVEKFPGTRIVSNCNSAVIHLYHVPYNLLNRATGKLVDYSL